MISSSIQLYNYQAIIRWFHCGGTMVKNPPASAGDTGDARSIPGSGRSSGEGSSNPSRYSCLKNPMGRGTYKLTIHEIAKNQTQLGIEHIHYDTDQK